MQLKELKNTNFETKTFEIGKGFMVDIVKNDTNIYAYIYHREISVKDLIVFMDNNVLQEIADKNNTNIDTEFINVVERTLKYENAIADYAYSYMGAIGVGAMFLDSFPEDYNANDYTTEL